MIIEWALIMLTTNYTGHLVITGFNSLELCKDTARIITEVKGPGGYRNSIRPYYLECLPTKYAQ